MTLAINKKLTSTTSTISQKHSTVTHNDIGTISHKLICAAGYTLGL